jgi:transcriptional regulator with XRE-family HTH domain
VHRLLNGTVQPSLETMEKIAKAFRKDPSYFVEYRVAFVLISIDKYLSDSPETATVWYHKMKGL